MRRLVIFGLILSILQENCYAQKWDVKPLQKGNRVPDLSFIIHKGDLEYRKNLSDYKGRTIILDFWDVNCLDCIASMPGDVEIQKRFNDKLQIILVTQNNR